MSDTRARRAGLRVLTAGLAFAARLAGGGGVAAAAEPHPDLLPCSGGELRVDFDDGGAPEATYLAFSDHGEVLQAVNGFLCPGAVQVGSYHLSRDRQRLQFHLTTGTLAQCHFTGVFYAGKKIKDGAGWVGSGRCHARGILWKYTYYDA